MQAFQLQPEPESGQGLQVIRPPAQARTADTPLRLATLPATESIQSAESTSHHPTRHSVSEGWAEVLIKLFNPSHNGKECLVYDRELTELEASLEIPEGSLLGDALAALAENSDLIKSDSAGQIINSSEIGETFDALYKLATSKAYISVAADTQTLYSKKFPLSTDIAGELTPIINQGEAVMVIIAKEPPLSAALELRRIADSKMGGLISLWEKRDLWDALGVSPALRNYLEYATVRVLNTGQNPAHCRHSRAVNQLLERDHGFENKQWVSLIKSVTQGERNHALKGVLAVCAPVMIGVKALESYMPGMMHSVGGMLDDLFGAIIPNVSQSMGRKDATWKERFKEGWPVLREGLISLPLAVGFGWGAAALHASTTSSGMHGLAGALFALACSAGTLGTSFGAIRHTLKAIDSLRTDPVLGEHIEKLGSFGRFKLALRESILDVPFRVGHTVIGVPLQIGLGIAAGIGGFFHNGLFVMAEGMLETVLGAATAFGLPSIKSLFTRSSLKKVTR